VGGDDSPVKAGFSVPKKKFKHSVDRHRIRRLMVESWRLNKHVLYEAVPNHLQIHVFLIFTDVSMPQYNNVLPSVVKGIVRLSDLYNNGAK
jgi:ribonuclease P protein component